MRRLNLTLLFPLLLFIGLVGYFLPWVLTPASSLSLGAYDLAEWSSIHPVVRLTIPFLWTAVALRIPLAVLGIFIAAYIHKTFYSKSIAIICLLIVAISLFPPLEFFTTYRDDPNYRQQFLLALSTVIVGILAIIWQLKQFKNTLFIALSILGVMSSMIGLYQAQNLMHDFHLPISVGSGGLITSIALVAMGYLYITKQSS